MKSFIKKTLKCMLAIACFAPNHQYAMLPVGKQDVKKQDVKKQNVKKQDDKDNGFKSYAEKSKYLDKDGKHVYNWRICGMKKGTKYDMKVPFYCDKEIVTYPNKVIISNSFISLENLCYILTVDKGYIDSLTIIGSELDNELCVPRMARIVHVRISKRFALLPRCSINSEGQVIGQLNYGAHSDGTTENQLINKIKKQYDDTMAKITKMTDEEASEIEEHIKEYGFRTYSSPFVQAISRLSILNSTCSAKKIIDFIHVCYELKSLTFSLSKKEVSEFDPSQIRQTNYMDGTGAPLEKLNILGINNTDLSEKQFIKLVNKCPKLTSLSLINCNGFSNKSLGTLESNDKIVKVNLYGSNFDSKQIAEICSKFKNIKDLNITCCKTDKDVDVYSGQIENLKILAISNTDLSEKQFINLVNKCCPKLTSLRLINCNGFSNKPLDDLESNDKILSVNLYGSNFDSKQIAEICSKFKNIKDLNITCCKTDKEIETNALNKLKNIERIFAIDVNFSFENITTVIKNSKNFKFLATSSQNDDVKQVYVIIDPNAYISENVKHVDKYLELENAPHVDKDKLFANCTVGLTNNTMRALCVSGTRIVKSILEKEKNNIDYTLVPVTDKTKITSKELSSFIIPSEKKDMNSQIIYAFTENTIITNNIKNLVKNLVNNFVKNKTNESEE